MRHQRLYGVQRRVRVVANLLIRNPHLEAQSPDSYLVAVLENDFAVQLRIVDVCAVGASKIAQPYREIVNRKSAVMPTALTMRRSKTRILAASMQKTRFRKGNQVAGVGAAGHFQLGIEHGENPPVKETPRNPE